MKNAVTTGDGVGITRCVIGAQFMRCPRNACGHYRGCRFLVYLPFFALAAVFGRLSAAAFDALLDVEADTFVTLPLLAPDVVGLLA